MFVMVACVTFYNELFMCTLFLMVRVLSLGRTFDRSHSLPPHPSPGSPPLLVLQVQAMGQTRAGDTSLGADLYYERYSTMKCVSKDSQHDKE